MSINTLKRVLSTARYITVSPISHKTGDQTVSGKDSLGDYNHQVDAYLNDFDVMWDDDKSNSSVRGDLFAFTSGQGRNIDNPVVGHGTVEIRRIVAILPQSVRHPDWDKTTHGNRNVLVLGDILYEGTLVELRETLGQSATGKPGRHSPIQGTKRWTIRNEANV